VVRALLSGAAMGIQVTSSDRMQSQRHLVEGWDAQK
jgi:hypothetical protein